MSDRIIISPLARLLAGEAGLTIDTLKGTGPNGRIIKRDIEAAIANPGANPGANPSASSAASAQPIAQAGNSSAAANSSKTKPASSLPDARLFYDKTEYDEIALSPMQAAIADRLTVAKQAIPHFYLSRSIEMDALIGLRTQLNAALKDRGEKLSLNDFLIRAVALALMEEPEVNVSFADDAILRHHSADIGIAVALPDGLITPIVKRANEKSVQSISAEISSLAKRAADRRLKPNEYEGGSFSVSNLGMFDIEHFTAVINPPQAAILAVGGTRERLVRQDGEIISKQEMQVTLSCDHRAVNGATGARFLQALRAYCAEPHLLLF
jgi:pyruvate dehydrogenase E2 component (dihydrolipoamide acetyltransferase)